MGLEYTLAQKYQIAVARQEIEDLRRLYASATDALGRVDVPGDRAYGTDVYHRIFTPDAQIRVTGSPTPLAAAGPDGWIEVVTRALKDYEVTQHLIGTQLVTFNDVAFGADGIVSGEATMNSYLHAWHAWPDRRLRLVLGTYTDQVRYAADTGWQIYDMTLHHASSEHRELGSGSLN